MKTVSQLGSGKKPVGTTAYLGRVQDLLQCCCDVQTGNVLLVSFLLCVSLCFLYFER
jgi:hypothetical protein